MYFNALQIQKLFRNEIERIKLDGSSLFFIGMMGSGKTTIGRIIAQILDYNFIEMDNELEKIFNMSIMDVFTYHGEKIFRIQEKALLQNISSTKMSVISCGGGVFTNDDNIRLVNKSGISIFLNAKVEILIQRLKDDNKRPLLKDKSINEILANRMKFYTQAQLIVDIKNLNLEEVVIRCLKELANVL